MPASPREFATGFRPVNKGVVNKITITQIVAGQWLYTKLGSGSWTCPLAGIYSFIGISGGACGGHGYQFTDGEGTTFYYYQNGGATGGYARKTINCIANQTYSFSIGSGARVLPGASGGTILTAPESTYLYLPTGTITIPAPASAISYTPGSVPMGGDVNLRGGFGGYVVNSSGPSLAAPTSGQGTNPGQPGNNTGQSCGSGGVPGESVFPGSRGQDGTTSSGAQAFRGTSFGSGTPSHYSNSSGSFSSILNTYAFAGDGCVLVIPGAIT